MSQSLQQKLRNYLDKSGLSVAAFERKAGLRMNVARNVLRGQSKKPTGETLQAIASAMGCSISDLLDNQPKATMGILERPQEASPMLDDLDIFVKSAQSVTHIMNKNKLHLSVRQALQIVEEVYAYSIKKAPPQVDDDFVEWLIAKMNV